VIPGHPLLSTRLSAGYPTKPNVLRELSLEINAGEILGLVGQSGSGKSTLALSILRLLDHKGGKTLGSVRLLGRELMDLSEREMRQVRGKEIGLVLQSPVASLNPALRIGTQLAEAWKAHARGSKDECQQRLRETMLEVSLPPEDDFLRRFPSQISMGQAQRVLIGMSLLHRPALLVADEPTSALDVITQAEIMELFRELNRKGGTGMLFISHDLLAVASLCNRIAILHEGSIVECDTPERIFSKPAHRYTAQLVEAAPRLPQQTRTAAL
jgi:ABC-type glutathione transport system ATPase component